MIIAACYDCFYDSFYCFVYLHLKSHTYAGEYNITLYNNGITFILVRYIFIQESRIVNNSIIFREFAQLNSIHIRRKKWRCGIQYHLAEGTHAQEQNQQYRFLSIAHSTPLTYRKINKNQFANNFITKTLAQIKMNFIYAQAIKF